MSKIPDTKKTKYNNNDPFRWIDTQWEKFMTEQKELKKAIKQLQDNLGTCTENFQKQRKQLEHLVESVPSHYLTKTIKFSGETHPDAKHKSWDEITDENKRTDEWRIEQFNRNRGVEDQVSTIEEIEEKVKELFEESKYVYESPDKGKTVYRRELGDYDTPRVRVDIDGKPLSEQLELFPFKA